MKVRCQQCLFIFAKCLQNLLLDISCIENTKILLLLLQDQLLLFCSGIGYRLAPENSAAAAARSAIAFLQRDRLSPCPRKFCCCCCKISYCPYVVFLNVAFIAKCWF